MEILLPILITFTIDDINLGTILTTEPEAPILGFRKKSLLHTFFAFAKMEYSSGLFMSEKPNKNSRIDYFHLKSSLFAGSVVNGVRHPKI